MTRRRSKAFSKHVFRYARIWPDGSLSTSDHGHTRSCYWCYQKRQQPQISSWHSYLCRKCAGWKLDLSQSSQHRSRHYALLPLWEQPDQGLLWTSPQTSLVNGWRVLVTERLETEHERANGNSKTTPYMFAENTYFIQMAPHMKTSQWRAESRDVPDVSAAPSWSLL